MKNYTTLLLDLDGTLLDIEVSFFLGPLVEGIHAFFLEDLLVPSEDDEDESSLVSASH